MSLTAAQVIDGALAALGPNGEHWCRGRLTDGNGNICLAGALKMGAQLPVSYLPANRKHVGHYIAQSVVRQIINDESHVGFQTARNMVRQIINDEYPDTGPSLGLWNDSLSDFGPVRAVLEKAKANLEG